MNFSDRIQTFEDLLSGNGASWDGMLLLAGDINLDIFRPEMSEMNYNELLDSLNVKQMVTKATRIAKTSKTLIDHIITNAPKRITYIEVLPCPQVSDRDVPFACVGITRYVPRYKLIRNEKRFSETASIEDFAALSLKSCMLSTTPITRSRLSTRTLLERTKVTDPPCPG